uniref:BHLH domain-containing protein n=1 Tax=Nelumbo nucifera TaxID=4432 RepID=A0A822Y1Q0_NELNU|nr:TPA_asm: hypothetical protein HUJ06_027371 [Nelumbo nucifera]
MQETENREATITKTSSFSEHYRFPAREYHLSTEASVRRTQKLGDRVTALQKLVSPFGKTDTASVLQEASVYIKLLHEQIYTLTIPYFSAGPLLPQGFEEKKGDLRSKGLCLVPVSFTQNLNKEGSVGQSISRRTCLHFP